MEIVFGVEREEVSAQDSSSLEQLRMEIAQSGEVMDRDDRLYIVQRRTESDLLVDLFKRHGLFEERFELYSLIPAPSSFNSDYGFVSENDHVYLYKDMVIPFQLQLDSQSARMAMMQMEEHLVAVHHTDNTTVYYADQQLEELIAQIAHAYHVSVTFL